MSNTFRNACAGILAATIAAALSAQAAQPAQAPAKRKTMLPAAPAPAQAGFDRFIVKYRDGARRDAAALALRLESAARNASIATAAAGRATLAPAAFRALRRTATGADVVRASRRLSKAESAAFLAALRRDAAVEYAQPDYLRQPLDVVPNDPSFASLQWDFTDETGGVRAPAAWDIGSGEGTVVAVLDSGYTDHVELVDNIVPGYDFITYYGQSDAGGRYPDIAGDGDGRDADAHDPGNWTDLSMSDWCPRIAESSWHGTHVAGTIAAVTNNGIGIAGLAHGAKVQPVRVLGHCGGITSDIADAIVWAAGGHVDGVPDNPTPAEVINLSLGGPGRCEDDPITQEAIDVATARGVTVVVAAGNDNDDAGNYSPASCRGVVTVGATGVDGAKSWFSNYGHAVALAAPGGSANSTSDPDDSWIWSLGNSGATVPADDVLTGAIGTSQAAPHVAATVAMMQSAAVAAGRPPLTPLQVKQVLRSTARAFPVQPPAATPIGAGILDSAAATLAATQDLPDAQAEPLVNRVALPAQAGLAGDELLYAMEVPEGARSLNLRSFGGSGDVSLYVSYGSVPTTTDHDRKSARPGTGETVVVTRPQAGTWYVRMVGETAFSNVSVMGLYL